MSSIWSPGSSGVPERIVSAPLHRLLALPRSPDATVAFGRDRQRDWADFSGRVEALAGRLGTEPAAGRWLLDVGGVYAFAISLFGLARAGAQAIVPPNRQPGTLAELALDCRGILCDDESSVVAGKPSILIDVEDPGAVTAPARPHELDPDAPLLTLFTSGTTGETKEVPKSLSQLDEVAVLEEVFGARIPDDCRIFSSAPPQHLYGLLFRILWPLASGRAFHTELLLHPEELLAELEKSERSLLAGTPSHLRRLAGRRGLRSLKGRLLEVFSSGGPLDPDTAASLAADLGEAPTEILGSTETGGIAIRRQGEAGGSTPWLPLPRVAIEAHAGTGQLRVRSPFVSVSDSGSRVPPLEFSLGDRVRFVEGGGFLLLGRADRVVKVGEKRLSLPEMESRLATHDWVREATLLSIEQGSEIRVAAAVVPSREGAEALAQEGRRAFSQALSAHLAPRWDRVLLPRAWRFVAELPRDSRGKTPLAALRQLFENPGETRPREPVVAEQEIEARSLERLCIVPTDLAQLEGHFEGFPLVAGVVQLGWAMEAARLLLGRPVRVRAIEALKFREILRPGDHFRLAVEVSEGGERIRFSLSDGARVFSSGRWELEASA